MEQIFWLNDQHWHIKYVKCIPPLKKWEVIGQDRKLDSRLVTVYFESWPQQTHASHTARGATWDVSHGDCAGNGLMTELMEPRPRAKGNTTAQLKIFTSGSFRPWSFILCRVFFSDSHLSNVTAEKFNRKESLRAQCPHHCFLFIQFNYHLLLTYSWPNFIFMYQRSEWPHLKSDSLPCLRFSLLVI